MTLACVTCAALPVLGGAMVAASTMHPADTWYAGLHKPPGTPPPWVFGPVWTVLYVLMGYAAYRVWVRGSNMSLFILQLGLNYAWTYLFFGRHDVRAACWDVLILLACVAFMTYSFGRTDPLAGYLVMPYLAWTAYDAYLTLALRQANGL